MYNFIVYLFKWRYKQSSDEMPQIATNVKHNAYLPTITKYIFEYIDTFDLSLLKKVT